MAWDEQQYDAFVKGMEEKYPSMLSEPYGGFCIGTGWWPIVESLCAEIHSHVKWKNDTRARLLKDNPYEHDIPNEVPQVVVRQIKEKFGGLRFYYDGGDNTVYGMVRMAEAWAAKTCEQCGKPGSIRRGGWQQTLCDEHEAERQLRIKQHEDEDY